MTDMMNPAYSTAQSIYNPTPIANQSYKPQQGVLYAFQEALSAPPVLTQAKGIGGTWWLGHPITSYQLYTKLKQNPQSTESFKARVTMYKAIYGTIPSASRKYLYSLLKQGRLTDTNTQDNRSMLAHLYSICSTPRAKGFDARIILSELLRILNQESTITQRFAPLNSKIMKQEMNYYNSGQGPKLAKPVDEAMLQVSSSATCVASSLMAYMVLKEPSEFVRQIAALTSPRQAFLQKVSADVISPEDTGQATQKLKEYDIPFSAIPGTNGSQYWAKVNLPYSGYLRAISDEDRRPTGTRGIVESVYQAALTHLVVQNYDPGLDMRVNPDGTLDPSKGLEEDRKTMMERIIKRKVPEISITYQYMANDKAGEPYLLGYFRNFKQTTQDLMNSLDMGEPITVGITDTDPYGPTAGRNNMGHELEVKAYQRNPQTGEIEFIVDDSDDGIPHEVKRSASELVPKIHHAGFPQKLAQKIQNELNAQPDNQYFIPDQTEAQRYELLATVPPDKQKAFLEEFQKTLQAEQDQQPQQAQSQQPQQAVAPQPQPWVPLQRPPMPLQYYPVVQPYYNYYARPFAPQATGFPMAAAYQGYYGIR
jgi:hypothetical protein